MMTAEKFWPIVEATWSKVPSLDISELKSNNFIP